MESDERNRRLGQLRIHRGRLCGEIVERHELGQRRYSDSWLQEDYRYMLRRSQEEFYSFRRKVEHSKDDRTAIEDLADMCNFALMGVVLLE